MRKTPKRRAMRGEKGTSTRLGASVMAALCGIIFLAFSTPRVAHADTCPDVRSCEKNVANEFTRGDYHALYDSVERLLLNFPSSPEFFVYLPDLVRLADVHGFQRTEDTLKKLLALPEKRKGEHAALFDLQVRLELEKLYARYDRGKADRLSRELFPVRQWRICGPFHKYGASDLEHSFLPEIARTLDDPGAPVKNVNVDNPQGTLDFKSHVYPEKGVVYAVATLFPGKTIKLRVYSRAPYVLFINGKTALINKKGGLFRSCRVLRVVESENVTVMMKVYHCPEWSFRILVTGEDDAPADVRNKPNGTNYEGRAFQEVLDFPHGAFSSRPSHDRADGLFKLGFFFDELESLEALTCYAGSLSIRESALVRYFLAQSMIEHGEGRMDSALSMEGWRQMRRVYNAHPDLVPAQHMRIRQLLEQRQWNEALRMGIGLTRRAPGYLPLRRDMGELLGSLGYEREFHQEMESFGKAFPASSIPLRVTAEYHERSNVKRAVQIYEEVLKKEYSQKDLGRLVALLMQQEQYDRALRVIELYDRGDSLRDEYAEILILSGRYEEAKRFLFGGLVKKESPHFYLRLGLISYLQNEDPSMNWKRMLRLLPSDFSTGDLLASLVKGRIENPFDAYRSERGENYLSSWALDPSTSEGASSRVVYRGRIFMLNHDGGSRAFFEDVVYIHDQKGIDKWGEYRAELPGEITPLRIRVYGADGNYSDSYRMYEVNNHWYVNLPSMGKGSLIHIAYYMDNPFSLQGTSNFFSVPFMRIQDFDEPLDNFVLRVVTPRDMEVSFSTGLADSPALEKTEENSVYTVRARNLPAVRRESFAGDAMNRIPFFAASTFLNLKDFARWYNGLLAEEDVFHLDAPEVIMRCRGKTVRETLHNVYAYISREIDSLGAVLYYPASASDTFYKKQGTAEDRVILAKAILNALGIRSYVAFARGRDVPGLDGFVSPEVFTHIMLYVPVTVNEGVWLDFNRPSSSFGAVEDSVAGTDAVVLLEKDYETKQITQYGMKGVRTESRITLHPRGETRCSLKMTIYGDDGSIRAMFRQDASREERLGRYFLDRMPSFYLERFEVKNAAKLEEPLEIEVSGKIPTAAWMSGGLLILQSLYLKGELARYIQSRERTSPLVMDGPVNESERYVCVLPREFKDSALSYSDVEGGRFGFAWITVKKERGNRELVIEREVHVQKSTIQASEYAEFLSFCIRLMDIERRSLLLRR